MIYFETQCGLIGDALAAVPYMLHRQGLSGQPALVGPDYHPWVWDGLDVAGRLARGPCPDGAEIVRVSPHLSWQYCNWNNWPWHMAEGHFLQAGMAPVDPFHVPLRRGEVHLTMPYVIAPFSNSDHNFNKKWPPECWAELIKQLGTEVWVIGAADDDVAPFRKAGAKALIGAPLASIVDVLLRCHCLITIDTGIGHLGVMLNLTNHVMIYPRTIPRKFAETPFGQNCFGPRSADIHVLNVLSAVQAVQTSG